MKKMNAKRNGGFTLIELLVVIAIIGILSSIVLVSLNSARQKGNDTRIISDVNQTRTQLESGYVSGAYPDITAANTYPATGNYVQLQADATSMGGPMILHTNATSPFTAYAVSAPMKSNAL